MAETEQAIKHVALEGRAASHAWVSVVPVESARRVSLRAPRESLSALSEALGLTLPGKPKTSAQTDGLAALWLGPDEWLLLGESDHVSRLATVEAFHSAVDVSHRNVGILVAGQGAEATIAAGCPQDVSLTVFPVGACTRTVLGKTEIVLWRTAETEFHVECWRSFSEYTFAFLEEAAKDAAA